MTSGLEMQWPVLKGKNNIIESKQHKGKLNKRLGN